MSSISSNDCGSNSLCYSNSRQYHFQYQ
jgi:hypothetical protein